MTVDDNDLAKPFINDVWLFDFPVRLANDAVEYFGIHRLSGSVQENIEHGLSNALLPNELNKRFNDSLPYVWVWRLSQRKHDEEKLISLIKALNVRNVPFMKSNLSLNGNHHEIERRWHISENTILLHQDYSSEADLAQALAIALNVPSEADFYENLLRCENESQRKEKLLIKGVPEAELEMHLREYSKQPEEEGSKSHELLKISHTPSNDGHNENTEKWRNSGAY